MHKSMIHKYRNHSFGSSLSLWGGGLLYFPLKAVNLHKSSLLWGVFWQPQLPHLHKDKWPALREAPKWYWDAFTLHQVLEGVTWADPNQWFPWLRTGNWEQTLRCISAGRTPAAPDCACPLRSHWWAIPDMAPASDRWVWNMHTTALCQASSEALVPGPDLVLVCSRKLCMLFVFFFPASFTCTCLFLTCYTNTCLWDSEPENVFVSFFRAYQLLFSPDTLPNSACFASVSFDHLSYKSALLTSAPS